MSPWSEWWQNLSEPAMEMGKRLFSPFKGYQTLHLMTLINSVLGWIWIMSCRGPCCVIDMYSSIIFYIFLNT